jgi:hypothetical protein
LSRTRLRAPRRALPVLALGALVLGACGGGEPFLDYAPQNEGEKTVIKMFSTRTTAAICYSGKDPETREIRALAAAHCAAIERVPRFVSRKLFVCAPRAPHLAYYTCETREYVPETGPADINPGSINIPGPAWDPNAEAPPPPMPFTGTPDGTPWDPTSEPPPATEPETPAAPSWDEGTTDGRGAFPNSVFSTMPRL